MSDTTHGCGQCNEVFASWADLQDHMDTCETYICGVCGEVHDGFKDSLAHRPCPEAEPIHDPEAEFREKRRKRKERQEFERKMRERRRWGLL